MDPVEHVKKLREDYERSLDAAESRRVTYHAAVVDLYRSGTPLREIAAELGLSHQRVHQIVSGTPPRDRNLGRVAGGIAGALVLLAAMFGSMRIARAPRLALTATAYPTVTTQAKSRAAVVIDSASGVVLLGVQASHLRPVRSGMAVVIDPATGAVIRAR